MTPTARSPPAPAMSSVFGSRPEEQRSAQLVFCDLSTPKQELHRLKCRKNGDGVYEMIPDQFTDVYNDLKKKLMAEPVSRRRKSPLSMTPTPKHRKKELFSKVRSGRGAYPHGQHSQKMGAGTNVQDRLIALHDLDCPWRPSNLAQRLGRIVRQGNMNPQVEIFRYVTEGTFDAYLYQLVENKQKFIAQIMTSKAPVRVADDVDETAPSVTPKSRRWPPAIRLSLKSAIWIWRWASSICSKPVI